jgi:hypothetical protein
MYREGIKVLMLHRIKKEIIYTFTTGTVIL